MLGVEGSLWVLLGAGALVLVLGARVLSLFWWLVMQCACLLVLWQVGVVYWALMCVQRRLLHLLRLGLGHRCQNTRLGLLLLSLVQQLVQLLLFGLALLSTDSREYFSRRNHLSHLLLLALLWLLLEMVRRLQNLR